MVPGPGWSEDTAAGISRELSRRELRPTQQHNISDNEGTTAQSPCEDEENGTKRQSMPVYSITVVSLDGKTREKIEVTGSKMPELATVKRPNMSELELV